MALELVAGAVVGVLFDQFRKEMCRVKDNVVMFKPQLEEIKHTLTVLSVVIGEIEESNRRLNRPNHGGETIMLTRLLKAGFNLVSDCSKVLRWDFLSQSHYREKLQELDGKIMRFLQKQTMLPVQGPRQMMIMPLNQQPDLTPASSVSSYLCKQPYLTPASSVSSYLCRLSGHLSLEIRNVGNLHMIMSLNQQRFSNLTMGFTDSSDLTTASSTSSSNIIISLPLSLGHLTDKGFQISRLAAPNLQMMIMSLNQQGFSNLTMVFTDSSNLTPASSTGSSNITTSLSTFGESNTSGSFRDTFDVLKGLISCASVTEMNLLADAAKIFENNRFYTRKDDLRKIVSIALSLLGYDRHICKPMPTLSSRSGLRHDKFLTFRGRHVSGATVSHLDLTGRFDWPDHYPKNTTIRLFDWSDHNPENTTIGPLLGKMVLTSLFLPF